MVANGGFDITLQSHASVEADADLLALITLGDPGKDAAFKSLDGMVGRALSAMAQAESFEGKPGQMISYYAVEGALRPRRVLVLGAGQRNELSPPQVRDLAASVAQTANKVGARKVAFVLPQLGDAREAAVVQFAVEGLYLGTYRFSRYLTSEEAKRPASLTSFQLFRDFKGKKPTAAQARGLQAAIARGAAVAAAINHARDLVNEPAAAATPVAIAASAQAIAKKHKSITVTVLDPKKCAELGMGMFLAVGKGSDQEPRFIHMTYKPAKKARKKLVFVGKGVTFDSGGYSLKPSSAMEDMKIDMSGAAAVISAMDAIATLGSEHEVHAIAACCENLVSGRAYKLGDVLSSMDGTTVEINNTDAEGRLTLGDALTYARTKIDPDEMFDFATLTGACVVALGPYTAGVMSDHEALVKGWLASAERTGEDMWRLPLTGRLREQLKSPIADMRNTGDRYGGAITAGLFLKTFAKDVPWVHVDIAGPASASIPRPAQPKGGTGFAVATIVEYATAKR
jgi:leucyl aminopeptidase